MARLLAILATVVALLGAADVLVARLVRADVAAARADMERTRAFQDFFFSRMQDLETDIGLATVRAHARWSALPAARSPNELRIILVGNSAGLFAVAPAELERRLARVVPDRTVTVIPLMIPSATIVDQVVLAKAAAARSASVVVALVDWDGFRSTPSVATKRIHELFADERDATGVVAAVDRWLDGHWTLYRTHAIVRALALGAAGRMWPVLGNEPGPLADALGQIRAASRSRDYRALLAVYDRIGYHPLMRKQYRGQEPLGSPATAAIEELGTALAHSGGVGMAVVMPFNPLLRGDVVGDPLIDPRAANLSLSVRASDAVTRLRMAGCQATNELDRLPATDFIDYVHVNAHGAERFSTDVAKTVRNALRKSVARRVAGAGPTALGVPHRTRHVLDLG